MVTNSLDEERRSYYRLQPAVEPEPQATFEVDGKIFDVKVVNLSPGGLLCYVNEKLTSITTDTFIPKIVIKVADKKPVIYAGIIVRVQPTTEAQKKFCGIKFVKFGEKVLQKKNIPAKSFIMDADDEMFLQRLSSCKSYLRVSSIDEEIKMRKMIYDKFQQESENLPIDERWYFHEVVDEMKLREPDYPEGLKVEFLRLCKGKESVQTVPEKKFGSNIKRFFKKILPL